MIYMVKNIYLASFRGKIITDLIQLWLIRRVLSSW